MLVNWFINDLHGKEDAWQYSQIKLTEIHKSHEKSCIGTTGFWIKFGRLRAFSHFAPSVREADEFKFFASFLPAQLKIPLFTQPSVVYSCSPHMYCWHWSTHPDSMVSDYVCCVTCTLKILCRLQSAVELTKQGRRNKTKEENLESVLISHMGRRL